MFEPLLLLIASSIKILGRGPDKLLTLYESVLPKMTPKNPDIAVLSFWCSREMAKYASSFVLLAFAKILCKIGVRLE